MFGCQDEANAVAETPLDHAIHGGVSEPVLNHALRMQILSFGRQPIAEEVPPELEWIHSVEFLWIVHYQGN